MQHSLSKLYNCKKPIKLLIVLLALTPVVFSVVYDALHINWCEWWPTANYFVGYDYGWGGRKLIGTIMGALSPQCADASVIRNVVIAANIAMILLGATAVWLAFRDKKTNAVPLASMLAIYLASPFSMLVFVFSKTSLVFMETYQLLLVLVWVVAFMLCRNRWYYYVLTFFVSLCGLLIHHTFLCTLYPLMLGLFVYDTFFEGQLSIKKACIYGANLVLTAGLFFALWQFSTMNTDLDSLYAALTARAGHDVLPRKEAFYWYYYLTNADNAANWMTSGIRKRFVMEFLLLLPIMLVFVIPWIMAVKQTSGIANRIRYAVPPLCTVLLTLPVFVMASDFTRWWVCLFFQLAALLVVSHDDVVMNKALSLYKNYAIKHWWVAFLLFAYMLQLHNSGDLYTGMEESENIKAFVNMLR